MWTEAVLSQSIWVPIAFGILVLALGDKRATLVRWVALLGSVVTFAITLEILAGFDTRTAAMQFVERIPWIPALNIDYHLGVDGISLWFVLLTSFLTILVVISS